MREAKVSALQVPEELRCQPSGGFPRVQRKNGFRPSPRRRLCTLTRGSEKRHDGWLPSDSLRDPASHRSQRPYLPALPLMNPESG